VLNKKIILVIVQEGENACPFLLPCLRRENRLACCICAWQCFCWVL